MSSRRKFVPIAPPDPDLTSVLKGSIFQQNTHEMPSLWTLQKVRKLRKLIITLFYIGLLAFPTSALPLDQPHTKVRENGNKITVKVKGCKSLSTEELRAMLGPAFDESRMVYDEASLKRSMELQSVLDEEEDSDIDDNDDALEDELKDKALIGQNSDKDKKSKGSLSVRDTYFMRRRRAADDADNEITNSQDDRQFLYQNLLHDTVRARSRQKRSYKRTVKSPPWSCKMTKTYRNLGKEGYFPTRILDGSCTQNTCFFGMYRCNPIKFTVKVLKRDPEDACRPVPLIGNTTTYEETWIIKREHVVVACECQYARRSSKRKRTKIRLKS